MHDKRIPLAFYVSPRLAQMAVEAARQADMTKSGYVRAALARALRQDGFDPAMPQSDSLRG